MVESDVIIVGGGPAGATCAWKLKQNGISAIVLDKKTFPRQKLCAGWITPKVLKDLRIDPDEYPHRLLTFSRLNYRFFGRSIPVRTRQYSIRRWEFDRWLIERSGVSVRQHQVEHIREEEGRYIVDDAFRCRYLVGAGGTHCRVYRTFFKSINPRARERLITSLEEEFRYDYGDEQCYLWYFDNRLPGYSWYVPKGNGYLNVGLGGKLWRLKDRGETIRYHWERFVEKLERLSLVNGRDFKPKGHNYYIRRNVDTVQWNNAFIIGDAAGLATVDMGEGIGPAVGSGILAAEAIASGGRYSVKSIGRYSAVDILLPWWKPLFSRL
ncbi:MAG: NAD(P)/FAD-dependent oxidoreductase [Proteobacteria bacterium]|nr:NAD(P)/FAD-dependent oxidoreductase [Pseudomonadota bacterium]